MRVFRIAMGLLLVFWAVNAWGGFSRAPEEWNQPVKPFRIIDNIYYVGSSGIASFLIATPNGHILLDCGTSETVPLVVGGIRQLGFKPEEVRILLNSHGHYDHAGGMAALKKITGAPLIMDDADALLLENGGKGDLQYRDSFTYPPVKVDRPLRNGESVELGGFRMTAHFTPGHTRGCVTWTLQASENGKVYDVVIVGGLTAPNYVLWKNPRYPGVAEDFQRTFKILRALPCDVFLTMHGFQFGLAGKIERLKQGGRVNPFFDPQGYRKFIEQCEKQFKADLEKQRNQ